MLTVLFLLTLAGPAHAQALHGLAVPTAHQLCRPAIEAAERRHGIPSRLLAAIGRVESGRTDANGEVSPWPWAVNAEGEGFWFNSKAEAVAAVNAMRARGVRSIDVGCMQVNLMHHPDAFASLEQAFDPATNADYAARFLGRLFGQTGTWPKAAAWYHSATPELGDAYSRRVMAAWPEEQKRSSAGPLTALANAWSATITRGNHPFLGRGEPPARIIPLAGATAVPATGIPTAAPVGRGLDAYRAMPVTWAFRPAPPPKPVNPLPGKRAVR
ncbi:MAG: lytic transglycosylase domain-containing protein [Acetobacteraceae bacterium]